MCEQKHQLDRVADLWAAVGRKSIKQRAALNKLFSVEDKANGRCAVLRCAPLC